MKISHNWNEWCGNLVRMITVIFEAEGHLSDHISIVSLKIIYVRVIEGESPSINSVYVDKTRLKSRGGVLPEKLSRGVRPASQNPYPIYDQNLRFSLPYL